MEQHYGREAEGAMFQCGVKENQGKLQQQAERLKGMFVKRDFIWEQELSVRACR